jgi:uncharacterized protein YegP (UPF0339 family)
MQKHIWEIYQDQSNQWRYRIIASNGRNVGSSGEGIVNLQDIAETVNNLKKPGDEVRILGTKD